ncbi:MAG: acetolactate synthase small subunit [Chitinophagaceae bacterium]|nr:acetolactate synthase small subunit [Chitinophagaceae bacterium]
MSSLYTKQMEEDTERDFTLSVLTEDKAGLLNHITIIFTRRKINIKSLNVSSTEVEGVSRFTIVVFSTRERIEKIVKQIKKLVDVLGAFLYEDTQIHYQELALYKVPLKIFMGGDKIEKIVRDNNARILAIEEDYIIIEKTGHKNETSALFESLSPYGVLEFVRSGRISMSMSKRPTQTFLKELEEAKTNSIYQ